jgi:hypothetical protein
VLCLSGSTDQATDHRRLILNNKTSSSGCCSECTASDRVLAVQLNPFWGLADCLLKAESTWVSPGTLIIHQESEQWYQLHDIGPDLRPPQPTLHYSTPTHSFHHSHPFNGWMRMRINRLGSSFRFVQKSAFSMATTTPAAVPRPGPLEMAIREKVRQILRPRRPTSTLISTS